MSETDPTDHALEQPSTLTEAAGYSKSGPGPMAAVRFKWTVRRGDDGNYYVDETIGDASRPIVTGPLSAAAAIRLVDERERQAQLRFEQLRSEMLARSVDGNPPSGDRRYQDRE